MILGIVASGGVAGTESPAPPGNTDAYFASVVLLIDAAKHSSEADTSFASVVLLIDGSKPQ